MKPLKYYLPQAFRIVLAWWVCCSAFSSAVGSVSPKDFRLPAPNPEPSLPAGFDSYDPPAIGIGGEIGVAEWTRTAGPGNVVVLAGPFGSHRPLVRVFSQRTASDARLIEFDPIAADADGASYALPDELGAWSVYLIWVQLSGGFALPVPVNRAEAWWIGPQEVSSGETTAVFGRNLSRSGGLSEAGIYIAGQGIAGSWLSPKSVSPYRVEFVVPPLAPGEYDVWMHNGHGGRFGWSEPVKLQVSAPRTPALVGEKIFDVKKFGAIGNGTADDTSPVLLALEEAARNIPSTLLFPAGIYEINAPLTPRRGVTWRGDGSERTILRPGVAFATASLYPFIFSHYEGVRDVEFRGLTFDCNSRLGNKMALSLRGAEHLRLVDVVLLAAGGGIDLHANRHLLIEGCVLRTAGVFLGDSKQVFINNSAFRLVHGANSAITSWGGEQISIRGCTAANDDPSAATLTGVGSGRFFVSQGHSGSMRHFHFESNKTRSLGPVKGLGMDMNQGEQILFEVSQPRYSGRVASATESSIVTADDVSWSQRLEATIVGGRGIGQARRIVQGVGNRLYVEPAFRIVPDSTSVLSIGAAITDSVVHRNELEGRADYATTESASVGVSLYGNVHNVVVADNRFDRLRGGAVAQFVWHDSATVESPSGAFFNLVTGNVVSGCVRAITAVTVLQHRPAPGSVSQIGSIFRLNRVDGVVESAVAISPATAAWSEKEGAVLRHLVFERNLFVGSSPRVIVNGDGGMESAVFMKNSFEWVPTNASNEPVVATKVGTESLFLIGNTWTGIRPPAAEKVAAINFREVNLRAVIPPLSPTALEVRR